MPSPLLLPLVLLATAPHPGPDPDEAPVAAFPTFCAEPSGRMPASTAPDPAAARALLRAADVIVRVRAVRELERGERPAQSESFVLFQVLGVLRGEGVRRSVAFPGRLEAADDFNEAEPPYGYGRPDSRDGSCFAEGYRAGAEYLLLLKRVQGSLTPYWAPMAPTGERLRGDADPWLAWVRRELRRSAAPAQRKAAAGVEGRKGRVAKGS